MRHSLRASMLSIRFVFSLSLSLSLFIFMKISITLRSEWRPEAVVAHDTSYAGQPKTVMRRGNCCAQCARGWSYVITMKSVRMEFTECAEVEWILFSDSAQWEHSQMNPTAIDFNSKCYFIVRIAIFPESRSQQSVGSLHIPRNWMAQKIPNRTRMGEKAMHKHSNDSFDFFLRSLIRFPFDSLMIDALF